MGGSELIDVQTSPCVPRDLRLVLVCEDERVEVTLWESTVMVVDQGDEAASWFTKLIGVGGLFSSCCQC